MTAWWPPADLPGLRVDFGERDWRTGRWERRPSAHYACVCGYTSATAGPKKVREFTATVPAAHRAACHLTPRTGERAATWRGPGPLTAEPLPSPLPTGCDAT
ncbi:hypothetical protein ACFYRC_05960 [Streptomyces sp. NPDC005279]|uniref:hypothetical protein n=1 Tax=Streptomyces sp. NPDC005279 TaxID=3364712 RepID=UPI00368844BF